MSSVSFDTHEVYTAIQNGEFNEKQTNSIFNAIKVAQVSSEVATKADIKELEYKIELIKKDIEILRADTQKAIENCKIQLIGWIGGFAVAGAGYVTWLFEFHK